jgi:hypothetical protein
MHKHLKINVFRIVRAEHSSAQLKFVAYFQCLKHVNMPIINHSDIIQSEISRSADPTIAEVFGGVTSQPIQYHDHSETITTFLLLM